MSLKCFNCPPSDPSANLCVRCDVINDCVRCLKNRKIWIELITEMSEILTYGYDENNVDDDRSRYMKKVKKINFKLENFKSRLYHFNL